MEPQSNVSEVQSAAWIPYVDVTDWTPRRGQKEIWHAVASNQTRDSFFAVLCTGYGKTLAACGSYAIARTQKRANRMLVLVPNDALRKQWANGVKGNMAKCGVKILGAYEISKEPKDIRYANDRAAEIFVATYQQALSDPQFWERLMSKGEWFVVYDECHHLSTNAWGVSSHSLPSAIRLYMTATPMRHDEKLLRGVPRKTLDDGRIEYVPDACVDYGVALGEGAVRPIRVNLYHYFVDVVLPDGSIERITTEKLRAEGVTDYGEYEKRRELRYKEKYLSPILLGAVSQFQAMDAVQPGQHQILVFAMSCKHAEHVAHAIAAQADVGRGFADWIGDARRPQENDDVLARYATGELKCLVQIDKAGEGFDNPRCSTGVFLHLIKSATKNTQQIGRLVRRNYDVARASDFCHILTSADAPIVGMALDFEKASDLVAEEHERQDRGPRDLNQPSLVDIKDSSVLDAELDRVEVHHVGDSGPTVDMQDAARGAQFLRSKNVPGVEAMSNAILAGVGAGLSEKRAVASPAATLFTTVTGEIEHERDRVKKVVGVLARNVVTLRAEPAGESGETRFERSLLGDTIKAIHSRWMSTRNIGHRDMTAEELRQKYEWIRNINDELQVSRRVPGWLMV